MTGNLFSNGSAYNEYQDVINFVAIRGSQLAELVNTNTVKLTNVILPLIPPELVGTFDIQNWFRVYINGDYKSSSYYTFAYNSALNEITFTFVNLGFSLDSEDEIAITGKFQEL